MVIAQGYSSAVAGKTPNLSLCNVDLPALFMGHYDNVTDAALAIVGLAMPFADTSSKLPVKRDGSICTLLQQSAIFNCFTK
jgi:hypothetical protein